MKLVKVESSNVSALGWDEEKQRLVVQFGDSWYEYDNVDAVTAARVIFADSIGKAFHQHIRAPQIPMRKIDARTALGS